MSQILLRHLPKIILHGTVEGSRGRGRPRKSWKDNTKEWTGQSQFLSSLVRITDDRDMIGNHHSKGVCQGTTQNAWASWESVTLQRNLLLKLRLFNTLETCWLFRSTHQLCCCVAYQSIATHFGTLTTRRDKFPNRPTDIRHVIAKHNNLNDNKKPTNWWGKAKRRAIQLYNLDRHSGKFSVSLRMILRQTMTELCASIPAIPVLRTSVPYLFAFCSRLEAASEIISGRFVRLAVPYKCVNFRDPRLNRSPEIQLKAAGGGISTISF